MTGPTPDQASHPQGFEACPLDVARKRIDKLAKEEARATRAAPCFDRRRYQVLHFDGRRLISSWLDKARDAEAFEAFIYAWISLNGWYAACTTAERDRDQLDMVMMDPGIQREFDSLMMDDTFHAAMETFRALWPIFAVVDLPAEVRMARPSRDRRRVVAYYHERCPGARRQPACHLRHQSGGGDIPLDWPHTLEALYRVRNNLFHGHKSAAGWEDRDIVIAATAVLLGIGTKIVASE